MFPHRFGLRGPRHGGELIRRIEEESRDAEFFPERQNGRFIALEVNAGYSGEARRGNAVTLQKSHGFLREGAGSNALPAPETEHEASRGDEEDLGGSLRRLLRVPEHAGTSRPSAAAHVRALCPVFSVNFLRPGEGNVLSFHERAARRQDGFGVQNPASLAGGRLVKGGEGFAVRARADNGLAARDAGRSAGEAVGAPEMPSGEAHGEAAALVHGHESGIRAFVTEERGGEAHGDARGAHADNAVKAGPRVPEDGLPDAALKKFGPAGTKTGDDFPGFGLSPAGESQNGHASFKALVFEARSVAVGKVPAVEL